MKQILFLLAAVFFCGCNKLQSVNNETASDAVTEITIPKIDLPHHDKYADLYDSVWYVPLESNDHCMFSYITKLEITPEGDFIILDRLAKKVLRFDAKGGFLNPIGELGHGRNEFLQPFDIVYNKYDNTVWVADWFKREILIYSLEGEILERIPSEYNLAKIDLIDEKHYCIYANYNVSIKNEDLSYNYNIINRDNATAYHFEKVKNNGSGADCNGIFVHHKGKLLSKPLYSNSIYEFDGKNVKKRFLLKYEDPTEWKDYSKQDDEHRKNEHGKKEIRQIGFSDKYIFIYISYRLTDFYSTCVCIQDLNSHKNYWFSVNYNDMNPDAPMDYFFDKITESHTYAHEDALSFEEYCQKKRQDNDTLSSEFANFKSLSQNINPILIVGKLK